MLSHEWQELQELTERITALRDRFHHARRSRQVGLMTGLQAELARVKRMREQVLKHVATTIGSRV
jgi:hypothetical protein